MLITCVSDLITCIGKFVFLAEILLLPTVRRRKGVQEERSPCGPRGQPKASVKALSVLCCVGAVIPDLGSCEGFSPRDRSVKMTNSVPAACSLCIPGAVKL